MKAIHTSQLIHLLKRNPKVKMIEASINKNGIRATHFLRFSAGYIGDEGIDGEEHQ